MNKTELIAAIAEKTEIKKVDVEKVITVFQDTIQETLMTGEKIQLTGFGTFEVAERAEREGRNPQTGESLTIKASKAPKFKASKTLKQALNE